MGEILDSLPVTERVIYAFLELISCLSIKVLENKPYFFHLLIKLLLQSHFLGIKLHGEMRKKQIKILCNVHRLLGPIIDLIVVNGSSASVLSAMELAQMIATGRLITDSPLLQIPHFCNSLVSKLFNPKGINGIYDILDLHETDRKELFSVFSTQQIRDIHEAISEYPDINIDLLSLISLRHKNGWLISLTLTNNTPPPTLSPTQCVTEKNSKRNSGPGWWVFGVATEMQNVVFTKQVVCKSHTSITVEIAKNSSCGGSTLTLYVVCKTVMGCDHEYRLTLPHI